MGTILALIIGTLYAILPVVINLLTMASVAAMLTIFDEKLFRCRSNVLEIMEDMFGYGSQLNGGAVTMSERMDLGNIIFYIALLIILVFMGLEVVSSMIDSMQGEQAQHPFKIAMRAVMTVLYEFLIFGSPATGIWFTRNGLISMFGDVMARMINLISENFSKFRSFADSFSLNLIVAPNEQIVMIVLAFGLFKSVIEAGIVFVERWLTFAMTVLLGPIFVSLNASKKTAETFHNWLMAIFSQGLTIFISYIIFTMFMFQMGDLSSLGLGGTLTFGNALFKYATAIALLALYKHSEKLLNAVGIRSIATADSLREYGRGLAAAGGIWRNTGGAIIHGLGMAIGKQSAGNITHSIASFARNHYGEDSALTRLASAMDSSNKSMVPPGSGAKIDQNGRYTTNGIHTPSLKTAFEADTMSAGKQETLGKSISAVNTAMDKGAGAPMYMKDVAAVNGLHKLDNLKTGSAAIVGEINTPLLDRAGEQIAPNIQGQVFSATRFDNNGRESNPQLTAIFPAVNGAPLNKGTEVSLGPSEMGVDRTFRVSGATPESLQGGSAYMYTLEASPINKQQFDQDLNLRNKYDDNYDTYVDTFTSETNRLNASLQVGGMEKTWMYSASDKLQSQMFGSNQSMDVPQQTYTSLNNMFNTGKESRKSNDDMRPTYKEYVEEAATEPSSQLDELMYSNSHVENEIDITDKPDMDSSKGTRRKGKK